MMTMLLAAVDAPTLPARLRRWYALRPQATFCTIVRQTGDERISYAQLYDRSCGYARAYRRRGIAAGDIITIVLPQSSDGLASFLGATLIGAVPTFLAPPSPKQSATRYWSDHSALCERIEAKLLVTYKQNEQAARSAAAGHLAIVLAGTVDVEAAPDVDDRLASIPADPDALACLQHSSGTTGGKKGVMLTHRAILDQVQAYSRALDFGAADAIASWLPLYHDMGFVACFLLSLVNGTPLVLLDPFEWVSRPHLLFDAIERHRTTFTWLPNFAFAHLVNTAPTGRSWNLRSVRAFIDCSEPCRPETLERFVDRFADCGVTAAATHVCYAMAENVFAVTQTELGRPPRTLALDRAALSRGRLRPARAADNALRAVSCGRPVAGVEVKLGGPAAEIGSDRCGEIFIRSPHLFGGYYRLPERSRAAFTDGWYATGDIGFFADGELYVSGRVDDMLIVNGRNYYAHEIETLVGGVDGVRAGRAVALGLRATATDATVVAVLLECRPGIDEPTLKRAVKERIFDDLAFTPHSVTIVPPGTLIKTTSGKLDRRRNTGLFFAHAANSGGLQ